MLLSTDLIVVYMIILVMPTFHSNIGNFICPPIKERKHKATDPATFWQSSRIVRKSSQIHQKNASLLKKRLFVNARATENRMTENNILNRKIGIIDRNSKFEMC